MKNRLYFIILLSVCFMSPSFLSSQVMGLPYFCGFETTEDVDGWTFKTAPKVPSEWIAGTAVFRTGNGAMYISSDGGVSATYEGTNTGYYVVAFRKFSLPAGNYDLSFDCRIGGEVSSDGKYNDALMAAWIPVSYGEPTASAKANDFPAYALDNRIAVTNGETVFANLTWRSLVGEVTASGSEDYYLTFVWKVNGGDVVCNPGACIDNVQIGKRAKQSCAERPLNLETVKDPVSGSFQISWDGQADEYEIKYFKADTKKEVKEALAGQIKNRSYILDNATNPEGLYTVCVRSICGNDTSIWSEVSDILLYNVNNHCLDYLNLYDKNTVCTSGQFDNPYRDTAVVNYGYMSNASLHTIHTDQDEYDPYTGGGLKTVPDGAVASVRICDRLATAASISYLYTVTEDADVLKLRYAAVLQYQWRHEKEIQTQIIVEILDAKTENLLNRCTYSEFNAKSVHDKTDNVRKWHEFVPTPDLGVDPNFPIEWSEWLTLGINLTQYIGREIKIRFTLKPCGANIHFAYAYVVLDCDKGEIDGVSCGEHPEMFRVPEGFYYRWYKTSEPEKIIGTENTFAIAPDDTAHYSVDLIFPEDEGCYFTMGASALPRKPIADVQYENTVNDCVNELTFSNISKIFGFWNGDIIQTTETCKYSEWNFGYYGKSTDSTPSVVVPAEGDTFAVTLRTSIDGKWKCSDDTTFIVEVPAITSNEDVHYYICENQTIQHNGIIYDKPGIYPVIYKNRYGCDSVVNICIDMLLSEVISMEDTICTGDEYDFHGKILTESGYYVDTVKSVSGCDSIIRQLDLVVNTSLAVRLLSDSIEACTDSPGVVLEINNSSDNELYCQIFYDEKAHNAGFVDTDTIKISSEYEFNLPSDVLPDKYGAYVKVYDEDCGDVTLHFVVDVMYPSSVIVQRWNDVLALQNADYNGGYEFSSYQWFKDGQPMEGEQYSVLYRPNDMDYTASYSMLLTRLSDGVSAFTCGITPVEFSDKEIDDIPEIVISGGEASLYTHGKGMMYLYGIGGNLVCSVRLVEGDNNIRMPSVSGIFIMKIVYDEGKTENSKIIIR